MYESTRPPVNSGSPDTSSLNVRTAKNKKAMTGKKEGCALRYGAHHEDDFCVSFIVLVWVKLFMIGIVFLFLRIMLCDFGLFGVCVVCVFILLQCFVFF